MKEMWQDAMLEAFHETSRRLGMFLPKLLALLTFVALGVVAGWLVKTLLMRLLSAIRFDAFCERMGLMPKLARARVILRHEAAARTAHRQAVRASSRGYRHPSRGVCAADPVNRCSAHPASGAESPPPTHPRRMLAVGSANRQMRA